MRDLSDDQLLTLAQDGDETAFAELMGRNSSSSFKLALSILKDRQEAEDEVQNSYLNAWRYLGRFQRDSKFSTWISRIVINQSLMRLRKRRKANFLYLDEGAANGGAGVMELPARGQNPEAELGSKEMSAILRREIRRMPPTLRSVLALRDLDELPMEDVAVRLGITLVAAKSRLMRARAELKQRLERQFGASERASIPA
ncbi:MAG: sigma-70 family RNA polymerase sigma factor [Bryobacteraceae bacterium]